MVTKEPKLKAQLALFLCLAQEKNIIQLSLEELELGYLHTVGWAHVQCSRLLHFSGSFRDARSPCSLFFCSRNQAKSSDRLEGKVQTCPLESVLHGPRTPAEECAASTPQTLHGAPWRNCGEILLKLIFIHCD